MKKPRQWDYVRVGQRWAQVASIEQIGAIECARLVGSVGKMVVPVSEIIHIDGRFEYQKK